MWSSLLQARIHASRVTSTEEKKPLYNTNSKRNDSVCRTVLCTYSKRSFVVQWTYELVSIPNDYTLSRMNSIRIYTNTQFNVVVGMAARYMMINAWARSHTTHTHTFSLFSFRSILKLSILIDGFRLFLTWSLHRCVCVQHNTFHRMQSMLYLHTHKIHIQHAWTSIFVIHFEQSATMYFWFYMFIYCISVALWSVRRFPGSATICTLKMHICLRMNLIKSIRTMDSIWIMSFSFFNFLNEKETDRRVI